MIPLTDIDGLSIEGKPRASGDDPGSGTAPIRTAV